MIVFRHGSHDSLDLDVMYVFKKKPTLTECQRFCADPKENRNIIVVRDGVVEECFKGLPDEVNNGLLRTYPLHEQTHPCIIERPVERNIPLKIGRGMRIILTRLTRTPHRVTVKAALRSYNFNQFRAALIEIDFEALSLKPQVLKSIAFQFGQMEALWGGVELFTKSEIAGHFVALAPFVRRSSTAADLRVLTRFRDALVDATACLEVSVESPLNFFEVRGRGPELLCLQSQGTICDLAAERCVAMGVTSAAAGLF